MLYKIFKYFAIAVGVIGLYFLIRIWIAGDDLLASADMQSSLVSPFLYIAYIIMILTIALVVYFVIKSLFSGNIKTTLIGIGSFVGIVLISYLISSGEPVVRDGITYSANTVRWISAGLWMFYILAILAIAVMVFGGAKKISNR